MDLKEIGKAIKQLRNDRKITQVELAQKANCSRSFIADLERGASKASLDTLKSIANALGVNLSYLLLKAEHSIPDEYDLMVLKIKNEFPQGITILKKATEELTKRQKKDLVEFIDFFIRKEVEKELAKQNKKKGE